MIELAVDMHYVRVIERIRIPAAMPVVCLQLPIDEDLQPIAVHKENSGWFCISR